MKKTLLFMSVMCGAIIFTEASQAFAQCNAVDAVTSASFKVTGGQACDITTSINWSFIESNGTLNIRWGTSTTAYGANVSLRSQTASNAKAGTFNITALQPNTVYYYAIDGIYNNSTHTYTRSSFKTAGGTVVVQPPVITSATAVTCTTGTTKTYTATATDPASKPVTFTFSGQPAWITVAGAVLTLKPVAGSLNSTVRIIASNGTAFDTLNLSVTAVQPVTTNSPPVFTSAAAVACSTGKTKTYTATATDANSDPITYTYSGLPAWMSAAGATLTMNATSTSTNSTVRIIAADGKGGLDTLDLAVTVVPVNTNAPPVFTSASAVVCTTGKAKTYTATATDANSDPITYTYSGLAAWMSATGATITMNATTTSANTIVTIIAADGKGGLDTLKLNVTVLQPGVNSPPVFTSATTVACTTGKAKTYTATAIDANGDPVTFTYSGLAAWMSASGATLTMNPTSTSANSTIRIIAADSKGGLDTLDLSITVVQPAVTNMPPVLTCASAVSCTTGKQSTYTAMATDANNDPCTFTFLGLSSWMSVSGATLTMNPQATNANSTTTVRIICADNKGGLDTLDLAVTVAKTAGIIHYNSRKENIILSIGHTPIEVPFSNDNVVTISLYRCNGALIMNRIFNVAGSEAMSLQNIAPGVYFMKVSAGKSTFAKNILVQR